MHFENKPHIFFRFTVFNYKRKYDIIKSIHLIIAQLTEYENRVSYSLFIVVWNAIFWWCQFMPYCNILMWQITFFKNNYHSISHPTCPSRTLTLTHQERRLCPFPLIWSTPYNFQDKVIKLIQLLGHSPYSPSHHAVRRHQDSYHFLYALWIFPNFSQVF